MICVTCLNKDLQIIFLVLICSNILYKKKHNNLMDDSVTIKQLESIQKSSPDRVKLSGLLLKQIEERISLLGKNPTLDDLFRMIDDFGPNSTIYDNGSFNRMARRNPFTCALSWCLPSNEIVQKISTFIGKDEPVLEIFSGRGLLAKLLQLSGINISATDIRDQDDAFIEVEPLEASKAIQKYKPRVLVLSWAPDWDKICVQDALLWFIKLGGTKVVWIGEYGGCGSGGEGFEKLLEECFIQERSEMPHWITFGAPIASDDLFLCTKR